MAISYVADASWSASSSAATFTLTKPTGTASGDYMVAIVALDTYDSSGGDRTLTPPAGWTSQGHRYSSPNCVIDVMTRTAGASEPGSWSGSFTGGSTPDRVSIVTTYRGVAGLAIDGVSSTGGSTSLNTATVNNPTATNWRVVAAAYSSASVNYAIESNEVTNRDTQPNSNVEAGMWDSNGTISTGNTSRNISRDSSWESAASWIGILDATDGAVSSGTLAGSLFIPVMDVAALLSYSGALDVDLLIPTMEASGIATPPEGTLDTVITPVMEASGHSESVGTLEVIVLPVMDVVGETRTFGIRVITPEAEERMVTPRLGAVD